MIVTARTLGLPVKEAALPALAAVALAFSLGAALVFGVGFAQPELLHNAAHDTRHAIGFPCH